MIIPGPGLKHPRGIRDPEEWYISLVARRDYIRAVFERQTETMLANIERLASAVGDHGQVVVVCDGDLGGQSGLLISLRTYRDLFSPDYRRINAAIHATTNWKTFKHCCGSVYDLIPDLIEDGFDILNPVQTSAARMDPRTLKREFGDRIVFWGGGVDTQRTLPFGTPEDVYREVRERIDIFNDERRLRLRGHPQHPGQCAGPEPARHVPGDPRQLGKRLRPDQAPHERAADYPADGMAMRGHPRSRAWRPGSGAR